MTKFSNFDACFDDFAFQKRCLNWARNQGPTSACEITFYFMFIFMITPINIENDLTARLELQFDFMH